MTSAVCIPVLGPISFPLPQELLQSLILHRFPHKTHINWVDDKAFNTYQKSIDMNTQGLFEVRLRRFECDMNPSSIPSKAHTGRLNFLPCKTLTNLSVSSPIITIERDFGRKHSLRIVNPEKVRVQHRLYYACDQRSRFHPAL